MYRPGRGSIEVAAPIRVDLSGGFTDVEPFSLLRPGRVINVALAQYVRVALIDRDSAPLPVSEEPGFVGRLTDSIAGDLTLSEIPRVSVRTSGVPTGCGLGTSGALGVALAHGLSIWLTGGSSRERTSDLACRAELRAGVAGGTQDQLASAFGGAGVVYRHGTRSSRGALALDHASLAGHLAVVYPGGARNSGSIIDSVTHPERISHSTRVVQQLNEIVEPMMRALVRSEYGEAGLMMNDVTVLMKELHTGIVVDSLRDALIGLPEVHGAKPCGAGGAASAWVLLVDPDRRAAFRDRIRRLGLQSIEGGVDTSGVRSSALKSEYPPVEDDGYG